MKKKVIATVVLLALPFLLGAESDGVQKEKERIKGLSTKIRSLYGLEGVYVLVESLNDEANQVGLTGIQLKTDIELILRLAGINVVSEENSFELYGSPYLYFNVNIMKDKDGLYIYSTGLELTQTVSLHRSPKTRELLPSTAVAASTWDVGGVGIAGRNVVQEAIRSAAKDLVNMFLNDYLTANPKK